LFLDPYSESRQIEWPQWLDFAKVGIPVVSLYLFAFAVPGHRRFGATSVETTRAIAGCALHLAA
jgi:hypothetical protein